MQENTSKATSIILKTLTVIVPYFYLIGYMYENGFYYEFGIGTNFFPNSMEGYLFSTFIAFIYFVISFIEDSHMFTLALAIGSLFVISMPIVFYFTWKYLPKAILEKLNRLRSSAKKKGSKKIDHITSLKDVAWTSVIVVAAPYIISSILVLLVLPPVSAFVLGKSSAKELKSSTRKAEIKLIDTCKDPKKCGSISGIIIARSTDYTAVYSDGTTRLIKNSDIRNLTTNILE